LLIADFRLAIDPDEAGRFDRGGSWHTTSSIDNRQSAIGNESPHLGPDKLALAARGRGGERQRFLSNLAESTLFAGNPEWYDAYLVSCPLSVVSR
jgi:hypothetical protein